MKIKAVWIENVQKIKSVHFEPFENGIYIIGGRNAQGKTSILRALAYLFGGETYRPDNFAREGADEFPYIKAVMDNGWTIERKGKNSALKITDPSRKVGGQTILDTLLTKLALNVEEFLSADDKTKGKILLGLLDEEYVKELEELDAKEACLYEERHLIGIEATRALKAAEKMPVHLGVPENLLSLDDLLAERDEITKRNAAVEAAKNAIESKKLEIARLALLKSNLENTVADTEKKSAESNANTEKFIADLGASTGLKIGLLRQETERQIAALKAEEERQVAAILADKEECLKKAVADNHETAARLAQEHTAALTRIEETVKLIATKESEVAEAEKADFTIMPVDGIKAKIDALNETNDKIRENIARAKCLKEANDEQRRYDQMTVDIEDVRRRRTELIAKANLPFPGLSVQNGILSLNGKTWGAMSGSEQMSVACSIIARVKPDCKFMLVDKCEQKDEVQLAEIGKWAQANGYQIIGTRVGTGPDSDLIIEDGEAVAGGAEE